MNFSKSFRIGMTDFSRKVIVLNGNTEHPAHPPVCISKFFKSHKICVMFLFKFILFVSLATHGAIRYSYMMLRI